MFFDKSIQLVNKLKNYTVFFLLFLYNLLVLLLFSVESKRDNGKNGSKIEMLCVFILVLFSLCLFSSVCFSYKINQLIFELELKIYSKMKQYSTLFFQIRNFKTFKITGN